MSLSRAMVISMVTLLYGLWLGLMAKQQLPLVLLISHLVFFSAVIYAFFSHIFRAPLSLQLLVGSMAGLLAASFSLAVVVLIIYGADQFRGRYLTPHFYFYPLASFGWLHGAIVVVALCWRSVKPDGKRDRLV